MTMSATLSLRLPVIGQRGLLCKDRDETLARGSSKSPCRAVRLVNFPRNRVSATGSDAFPPKSSGAVRSGIDEAMGPWLCLQEGEVLLLAQQTVHMDSEYSLQMCCCVTKLQMFSL